MYRRLLLVFIAIAALFFVYSLARPKDKPALNIEHELSEIKNNYQADREAEDPLAQIAEVAEELDSGVAAGAVPYAEKIKSIEEQLESARRQKIIAESKAQEIELEIFIQATQEMLARVDFQIQNCDKYKNEFLLKYHPASDQPMSSGTEKAYRLLEGLCAE